MFLALGVMNRHQDVTHYFAQLLGEPDSILKLEFDAQQRKRRLAYTAGEQRNCRHVHESRSVAMRFQVAEGTLMVLDALRAAGPDAGSCDPRQRCCVV